MAGYDVFISYSRKDTKVADEICSALADAGLTFFIDREGIGAGQNFPEVLARAVDDSSVFLFLASQNSFNSKFTRGEVTYAFNHKRSGCIIPYIIDGSETMPPDLELMLGNFNWRRRELCPIRTKLIDDIQYCIANPDSGTVGGRAVMTPRKKKIITWSAVAVVAILLVSAILSLVSRGRNRAENRAAMDASRHYEQLIGQADSLLVSFENLKSSPNTLETTGEQIADLQLALRMLDSAGVVGARFGDSSFKGLFNKDIDSRTAALSARLDSIHRAWAEYAMDSYSLYQISQRESERQNVLSCIDFALSIKPDPELERIKQTINR